MPAANWNGKFQAVGNGGLGGRRSATARWRPRSHRGYATASTDTGHMATPARSWALGHPEKLIVDFGYRAIHEMTVDSEAIDRRRSTAAVRGCRTWNGCSTGGRQGLMEAQRYPDDYDGIVAGAPANSARTCMPGSCGSRRRSEGRGQRHSAGEATRLTQQAALDACDATRRRDRRR